MNLSTIVVLLLLAAWAVWAVRRLLKNGMCDCHANEAGGCGCSGGCGGCHGCASAQTMVADMTDAAKR